MSLTPRLTQLRFGLSRVYASQARGTRTTPGLHHLLAVPIHERLVLLARLEGATPFEISRALKVSLDDAKLQSARMVEAVATWKKTLQDPYWHLPERSGWRHGRNTQVERALTQLLYADVAVCLFGEAVPPPLGHLSLRQKAIMYCLLVEHCDWETVRRLIGCTGWEIRTAINEGMEVVRDICGKSEELSEIRDPLPHRSRKTQVWAGDIP